MTTETVYRTGRTSKYFCPHCKEMLSDNHFFCMHCGRPVLDGVSEEYTYPHIRCKKCKKEQTGSFGNFCDNCGEKLLPSKDSFYIKIFDHVDKQGFINLIKPENEITMGTKYFTDNCQTQFTIKEIVAIDPRLLFFAIPVKLENVR